MDTTTQAPGTEQTPAAAPQFPEGTKLREYETIYLVKQDLADEAVDRLKERIRGVIAREGGKAIKFSIWGKKKTNFEIAKQSRAIYTHVLFLGGPKLVAEIERNLRMIDDVVRYQTIKISDESDANRPVEQDVKMAGDADQPERPPREERERRDDFGGESGGEDVGGEDEGESA